MTSFTLPSIRALAARRNRVHIRRGRWNDLIIELRARAGGVRESGAFLLATRRRPRRVVDVVYFDDLDPNSLTGGVSLPSAAFAELWDYCSTHNMRVVADVHTHPGDFVAQSDIDRSNPMIAKKGHIAIIVPHLARRPSTPRHCGVHEYLGDHRWNSVYRRGVRRHLRVGRWA